MLPKENHSCWSKIRHLFSQITVEPAHLMFSISQGLYLIVADELYISKVCKVNFGLDDEVCDNLQQHEEQVKVQKYVSTLRMYNSVLQAIPSIIFALFSGPWSDTNGRKLLIVLALFGFVLNNGVFMINTYWFYELKAEYLLFECLQDMTGGFPVFFMSVKAYIFDVTDPSTRTKRLAFLTGLWPIGFNIGKALSGVVKKELGFMYNFGLGMAMSLLAMMYMIIFVKDSITIRNKRLQLEQSRERADAGDKNLDNTSSSDLDKSEPAKMKFVEIFNLNNLKQGFHAILKKRPHNLRLYLLLMILCYELEMFNNVGDRANTYLYLRRALGFTMVEYTHYTIYTGVLGVIAQYVSIPLLSEYFKLQDSIIILIDISGCFFQAVINALATSGWMLYLSASVAFLDGTTYGMISCLISKCVEPDEIGKVLSITSALQSCVPLVASPFFGLLYRNTVEAMPNAFLLAIAGMFALAWLLMFWVKRGIQQVNKKHEKSKNDNNISEKCVTVKYNDTVKAEI